MTGRQQRDFANRITRFEELANDADMSTALSLRRTIKRLRAAVAENQQVEADPSTAR